MLVAVEKVMVLQNVDVFAEVPTEQLSYLAAIAHEVEFTSSEVIFEEADPSEALYIVLEGKIRLSQAGKELLTIGKNEVLGAWALFDSEPRVATAMVIDDARLLQIDREEFVDLLADHVQITQGVLKTMARRLRGLAKRAKIKSEARASEATSGD